MADSILSIAALIFLTTLYATSRVRFKFSLIPQFFIGWLIIELAWFHAFISAALIALCLFDIGDFGFSTLLGIGLSIYNIYKFIQLHQQALQTKQMLNKTLTAGLGENYSSHIIEDRKSQLKSDASRWKKPFSFHCDTIDTTKGIQYGPYERNTLDLYKSTNGTNKPKPVMLQIHGGGWVLGFGDRQALPLRNKLVEAGWIFIAINYRLSPADKFPAHLIDCKQALNWIKENIADYGGDPDFILTTGGSAGGHLCSLLALTANQQQELLQPGFEKADLSVQGCLPMYGVYDFCDRNQHRPDLALTGFLEDYVMPEKMADNPELWDIASPIVQTHAARPPFMVCHGELDTLSFVEDAQHFVKALRESSEEICVYSEFETTQHAFDIFYSPRCIQTVDALHEFSEYLYSAYLTKKS